MDRRQRIANAGIALIARGGTHRLTHRLLMITPFQTQQRPSEHLSDGLWVSLEHLADYGLPKPLIKYLAKG